MVQFIQQTAFIYVIFLFILLNIIQIFCYSNLHFMRHFIRFQVLCNWEHFILKFLIFKSLKYSSHSIHSISKHSTCQKHSEYGKDLLLRILRRNISISYCYHRSNCLFFANKICIFLYKIMYPIYWSYVSYSPHFFEDLRLCQPIILRLWLSYNMP